MSTEIEQGKVNCSGCWKVFTSIHPNNYYQFCSTDCREIIQDNSEEIIDGRHLQMLMGTPQFIQQLINNTT